jgi:hypothetical protein
VRLKKTPGLGNLKELSIIEVARRTDGVTVVAVKSLFGDLRSFSHALISGIRVGIRFRWIECICGTHPDAEVAVLARGKVLEPTIRLKNRIGQDPAKSQATA